MKSETRLAICMRCPHKAAGLFGGGEQCKRCGCFIRQKVRVTNAKCPDGRWK